jgi:tryptophan 2-monooxygenase
MSIFSLPRGIHRKQDGDFKPNSMIDILFDYRKFLGPEFTIHKSKVSYPEYIAIIGAGAAGLFAGILLLKAGFKVKIFEASARNGGRMYSVYPDDPKNKDVFELGCMRFPPSSKILFELFRYYNIKVTRNFPDPGSFGVEAILYYENKKIPWPSPKNPEKHSLPESAQFKKLGYNFGCLLRKLLGDPSNVELIDANVGLLYNKWNVYQIDPTIKNRSQVIDVWQKLIDSFKNVSFYEALNSLTKTVANIYQEKVPLPEGVDRSFAERPWTQEDMNAFGALGVGSGGFGALYSINFLELLRIIANGWEDGQVLVPQGIDVLVQSLESDFLSLGGNIVNNKYAQLAIDNRRVVKDEFNMQIITVNYKGKKHFSFPLTPLSDNYSKGMIVATTSCAAEMIQSTIAKSIDGYSYIREENKVSIRNLSAMSSSKFFIRVSNRFWEDRVNYPDCPSNIQTDELPRGVYCLNYGDIKSGVILVSYVWGNDSIKIQALTKRQRFDFLLNAISVTSPIFAQGIIDNCNYQKDVEPFNNYIDWQNSEKSESASNYAYGAFKLNLPGQEQMCSNAFFNFQFPLGNGINTPPIIFCGDSFSWAGGWVEGALTTAVNAACGILEVFDSSSLKDGNPMENIQSTQYRY